MLSAALSDLQTRDDSCFLCGAHSTAITQEHVFPKWLQRRYDLWNQRIGLLNDTKIQYRNLRIPCCSTCNTGALSRLEASVASAVDSGYDAVAALDERELYLWSAKIFYGILRNELNLLSDRSRPAEGSIVSEVLLRSLSNLHLFLQGIRGAHTFSGAPPYSVLVCNVYDLGRFQNYCFRDSLAYMTLAIRMGEVAVVVAFEDAGLSAASYGRYVAEVAGRKLHPIQFDELYARVTYQVSLLEGTVKYVTSRAADEMSGAQTTVFGSPYVRERSQEEFSRVLRVHVSPWLSHKGADSDSFVPPNLVPTWMTNDAGELLLQPLSSWAVDHRLDA